MMMVRVANNKENGRRVEKFHKTGSCWRMARNREKAHKKFNKITPFRWPRSSGPFLRCRHTQTNLVDLPKSEEQQGLGKEEDDDERVELPTWTASY